jgi:hypothetical protein
LGGEKENAANGRKIETMVSRSERKSVLHAGIAAPL